MRKARRAAYLALLVLPLLCCACGKPSPPAAPVSTGAREKTQEFFEALVARDWSSASASLDAASQKKLAAGEFARAGERYLEKLGFVPAKVHIRFCDEKGDLATVHVLLTTATDSRKDSYRESIQLKREEAGWRVVLPGQFSR